MYANVHRFSTSNTYSNMCSEFFPGILPKVENLLGSKIVLFCMKKLLSTKEAENEAQNVNVMGNLSDELPEAVIAKERYIAGYCVHSVKKKIKATIEAKLMKPKEKQSIVQNHLKKKEI